MKAKHHPPFFSLPDCILQKRSAWLEGTCVQKEFRQTYLVRPASLLRNVLGHNYGMERLDVCNPVVINFVHRMIRTFFSLPLKNFGKLAVDFSFAKIDSGSQNILPAFNLRDARILCLELNASSIKIRESSAASKIPIQKWKKFSIKKKTGALLGRDTIIYDWKIASLGHPQRYMCHVFLCNRIRMFKASLYLRERNARGIAALSKKFQHLKGCCNFKTAYVNSHSTPFFGYQLFLEVDIEVTAPFSSSTCNRESRKNTRFY